MKRSKPTRKRDQPARTTGDPLLDAALAAVAGAPDVSAEGFRERLCDDPEDMEALFELGNALDDIGRGDDAVALWRRLVERYPEHQQGWYNLGVAAKEHGRWSEALPLFDRAHELDPDDAATLHCRGHVHQELGDDKLGRVDLEQAIAKYSELLADDPEEVEALFWRGAARARLGERGAALADLAAAIELEPTRRCEARGEVDFQSLATDPEFIRLTSQTGRRRR